MHPKLFKIFYINFLLIFLIFIVQKKVLSENFYDYPLLYLVEACKITKQRYNPEEISTEEMIIGREKYNLCMNFIMALSTTLNSRCMNLNNQKLTPEENLTYADLSEVHSTQELIKEVLLYSRKHPQFDNQIAWLHASKAISMKWPCKKK